MDNTIRLSRKPDLTLDLSGYYQSAAIQGTYDVAPSWSVNAGVKWTFDKSRASLSGALQRHFRKFVAVRQSPLQGTVPRHGFRHVHPFGDGAFLLPFRHIQGEAAQDGRHVEVRALTGSRRARKKAVAKTAPVLGAGIEPARPLLVTGFLSPACLPIPPSEPLPFGERRRQKYENFTIRQNLYNL